MTMPVLRYGRDAQLLETAGGDYHLKAERVRVDELGATVQLAGNDRDALSAAEVLVDVLGLGAAPTQRQE